VKAGAPLGAIAVNSGGYAVAGAIRPRTWKTYVDLTRRAQARNGVPTGAGNFGFVASRPSGAAVPADIDQDGVPAQLDIDDDGDLVLDNFDAPNAARVAQAPPAVQDIASHLIVKLEDTANVNAGGLSIERLDATLSSFGLLFAGHSPTGVKELDCGGLVYCSHGGTGTYVDTNGAGHPFPACCDADGDGFGTTQNPFQLRHGATSSQIRSGNVLIERVSGAGPDRSFPMTVQTIFATVPALISYTDGAGNTTGVSYPLPAPYTGSPPGPGASREGLPVSPSPSGDMVLTFTFWRPQRLALPGEAGTWTDIGGLLYGAEPPGRLQCPPSTYSIPPGQPLSPDAPSGGGVLRDSAGPAPADPQRRLAFTLNVSECLAAFGASWDAGESMEIGLIGTNGFDVAWQRLYFRRP
jgi:hypothetical protein